MDAYFAKTEHEKVLNELNGLRKQLIDTEKENKELKWQIDELCSTIKYLLLAGE